MKKTWEEVHEVLKSIGITFATDGLLMSATIRGEASEEIIKQHLKNSITRRYEEARLLENLLNEQ